MPAVIIKIQRKGFAEEEQRIEKHDILEDACHVAHDGRVKREQGEGQKAAQRRRDRIGDAQQAGELISQFVEFIVAGFPADDFNDHREQRHAEDEGAEEQVHLRDEPNQPPRIETPDLAIDIFFLGMGRVGDQQQSKHGQGHKTRQREPAFYRPDAEDDAR